MDSSSRMWEKAFRALHLIDEFEEYEGQDFQEIKVKFGENRCFKEYAELYEQTASCDPVVAEDHLRKTINVINSTDFGPAWTKFKWEMLRAQKEWPDKVFEKWGLPGINNELVKVNMDLLSGHPKRLYLVCMAIENVWGLRAYCGDNPQDLPPSPYYGDGDDDPPPDEEWDEWLDHDKPEISTPEPVTHIDEFQTRDSDGRVLQHSTFDEAYSVFKSSDEYFKISYGDTEGKAHRWIWMKKENVWADKPIVIETKFDGFVAAVDTTDHEIERLTNEEFRAIHQ